MRGKGLRKKAVNTRPPGRLATKVVRVVLNSNFSRSTNVCESSLPASDRLSFISPTVPPRAHPSTGSHTGCVGHPARACVLSDRSAREVEI